MSHLSAATPSLSVAFDPAESFADILRATDAALANHGSKNYVEKIDFVDIMLDIRKIAFHAIDILDG